MIEVNQYKNKLIGLFGLGKTGISAFKSLTAGGAKIICWDDSQKNRDEFKKISAYSHNKKIINSCLQDLNSHLWNEIDILILSPGIPTNFPRPHKVVEIAKRRSIQIICDIELLYQTCKYANFIAITGTNGKSTTTSLIGHILKSSDLSCEIGGNIGIASLDLQRLRFGGSYVIECSSFQLELIDKFAPNIAVLLNITPDHLDRYKNLDTYIDAKLNIFKNHNDICAIGIDDKISEEIYEKLKFSKRSSQIIPFSVKNKLEKGAYVENNYIFYNYDETFKIKLPNNNFLIGEHNKQNMLASVICAFKSGAFPSQIEKSLENFVGLKHRMEYLGEKHGITFINDSKATNPESAEKALGTFDNILWIVGGYVKGKIDMHTLSPLYSNVKKAFLIGKSSENLAEDFSGKIDFELCGNLENAVKSALSHAKKGDVILLSPSFASFDQFKNFEHRGECFRDIFNKLA